ncbi:hypothetical protein ACHAPU_010822 [Fusarium lateritium]
MSTAIDGRRRLRVSVAGLLSKIDEEAAVLERAKLVAPMKEQEEGEKEWPEEWTSNTKSFKMASRHLKKWALELDLPDKRVI